MPCTGSNTAVASPAAAAAADNAATVAKRTDWHHQHNVQHEDGQLNLNKAKKLLKDRVVVHAAAATATFNDRWFECDAKPFL